MQNHRGFSRRQAIAGALGGAAAVSLLGHTSFAEDATPIPEGPAITKNRLKQTICAWCFAKNEKKPEWSLPLPKLCEVAVKLGYKGIDLVEAKPDVLETLRKYNLTGSMVKTFPIPDGLNRIENHEKCLAVMRKSIDFASEAGFPNIICFSGNRKGMADDEGLKNCAEGLKKIVGYAEEKKVVIHMELLNSKVNHPDYMCDNSNWGVELCKAVGSEHFKLLYDIYHMQIDEGNVIATIRKNHQYFGHYHTAGVPGRHEIDDSQELYYPAVMKAIAETKFEGWVGQEFIPVHEPVASLAQAGKLCDV